GVLFRGRRKGIENESRAEPRRLGAHGSTDVCGRGGAVMAAVHLRNVEKYFGGTHVIRGVSVDIADGEFAVLVGPSGCGKSTLLRMIAGLEEITGGEIEIGGRVVNHLAAKERDIAMGFQNYARYPHLSAR